jgi:hypothetical protein
MPARHIYRKRPCRICRRWFRPHARVGERQKTCGAPDCQRKWHAKKCAEWNRRHKAYHCAIYLSKKLSQIPSAPASVEAPRQKPASLQSIARGRHDTGVALREFQDVISPQLVFIINYMIKVGLRRIPLLVRAKRIESLDQCNKSPPPDRNCRSLFKM